MSISNRLRLLLIIITLVILAGSAAYYVLGDGDPSFLTCIYMTVVSLTSVGYGEIVPVTGNAKAMIFTTLFLIFGLGVITYAISTMTALIVEGEVSGLIRRRSMEKRIAKMSRHFIVCGSGQTGRHVLEELVKNKEDVVLVEADTRNIEQTRALVGDIPYIEGDATEDKNLLLAGIKEAAGVVVALPSDKDTLYVTMSARMLNPKVRIISRMTDLAIESKLRKAGADSVVSPNFIGGLRMASELIRPTAVSFLDRMLRTSQKTLRVHEIVIKEHSPLCHKAIKDCHLKQDYDLMILGVQVPGTTEITFNPPPDLVLNPGATLVVMGDVEKISELRKA
ncbi:MAG: potassium channel protein [Thermodesulfobacteriota bacterium]